jgi:ATP-dependent RNA helicase DeaD
VYGILFCRTKREVQEVVGRLTQDHYSAEAIHGDIAQAFRTDIMDRFKKKQVQLLVATDVAARGIDVKDLTHIINYSLPDSNATYIHRSGRTGRAKKSGVSLSLINPREVRTIRDLERKVGKPFKQKEIPQGQDICEKQLFNIIDKIKKIKIDDDQISPYLPTIYKSLEELNREELIKAFVSAEFNHFLAMYKNAGPLDVFAVKKERTPRTDVNFCKFQVNLGRKDRFTAKDLFGIINRKRDLKGTEIGQIEIGPASSVFEIEEGRVNDLVRSFKNEVSMGRRITMTPADGSADFSYTEPKRASRENNRRQGFKKFDRRPSRPTGKRR